MKGPLAWKMEAQEKLVEKYIDEVTAPASGRGLGSSPKRSSQTGFYPYSTINKSSKSVGLKQINKYLGKQKLVLLTN